MIIPADFLRAILGTVVIWLVLVWVWASSSYSEADEQTVPTLYKLRIPGRPRHRKRINALSGFKRRHALHCLCWLLIAANALPSRVIAGSHLTHTNTQVTSGQIVNIQSGGDTTLKGAVVSAPTVNAQVGGNLKIESLQDTARFDEKQTNAGFGVTLCIPPLCIGSSSATVSAGKTNINSNYASVTEQSGIKAGDGGFNVNVLGATDLKGGVISSTDKAHNDGKNGFASAGGVTLTDIQNSADYKAGGLSITAGYSGAPQDGKGYPVKDNAGNVIGGKFIGGGGLGSEKGSATSTTQAGITGIAGNTAAIDPASTNLNQAA